MFDLDSNSGASLVDYWTTPGIDNPTGDFAWLVLAVWNRSTTGTQYLLSQGSWGASASFNLYQYSTTVIECRIGTSTNEPTINTGGLGSNPWLICVGAESSATKISICQPGDTSVTSDTGGYTSVSGTAPTDMHIGSRSDLNVSRDFLNAMGQIQRVDGIFPSDEQLLAIVNGRHPLAVLGAHTDFYWWGDGAVAANQADAVGGATVTRVGSPVAYAGGAVRNPWPVSVTRTAPVVGGSNLVGPLAGQGGLAGHGGLAGIRGGLAA